MNKYDIIKRELEKKFSQYNTTFGVRLLFSTSGDISVGDFDKRLHHLIAILGCEISLVARFLKWRENKIPP